VKYVEVAEVEKGGVTEGEKWHRGVTVVLLGGYSGVTVVVQ
jgi:hypothetical protein